MDDKISMHSHKQTQSEFNSKKRKEGMKEFQPIEFIDLIQPKEEKDSSDIEEAT